MNKRATALAFSIFMVSVVLSMASANAYVIEDDTVYWENSYGKISVWPHTSYEFMKQTQYANITSYLPSQGLDFAFRFDFPIKGRVYLWDGSEWKDKTNLFEHTEYAQKHYYWIKDVYFEQDETKRIKWTYYTPPNSSGKWELWTKRSSDTLFEALNTSHYIRLDPWYSSSWLYRKQINFTENSGFNLTNYSVLIENFDCEAQCQSVGEDIRVITDNGSVTTALAYGLQYIDSSHYNITFRINLEASTTNTSIYVYYGNGGASASNSSWNSTRWHWHDDFEDASLSDIYIKDCVGSTATEASGNLTLDKGGCANNAGGVWLNITNNFTDVKMIADLFVTASSLAGTTLRTYPYSNSSDYPRHNAIGDAWTSYMRDDVSPANDYLWQFVSDKNTVAYEVSSTNLGDVSLTGKWWQIETFVFRTNTTHSNFTTYYDDGRDGIDYVQTLIIVNNWTGNYTTALTAPLAGMGVDNLRVRKHIEPEPNYTVGSQAQQPGVTITGFNITIYDEMTEELFNMSLPNTTTITIYCSNETNRTTIVQSVLYNWEILCPLEQIRIDMDFGNSYGTIFRALQPEVTTGSVGNITFFMPNPINYTVVTIALTVTDLSGVYTGGEILISKVMSDAEQDIIEQNLGLTDSVTLYLIRNERYRVTISRGRNVREADEYVVVESGADTITISEIRLELNETFYSEDILWGVELDQENDFIRFIYNDTLQNTINVTFEVYNGSDTDQSLFNDSVADTDNWISTYTGITANESFTFKMIIWHNELESPMIEIRTIGYYQELIDLPINDDTKLIIALAAITLTALVFGSRYASLGAIAVAVEIAFFTFILGFIDPLVITYGVMVLIVLLALISKLTNRGTKI